VDVACPASLLAVEIDGSSHNTRKWKFLDARKTEVLNALGWRVLRFSNQQVREDLPSVLDAIKSSMTLR
jgi:ATP-dependent DNA helicase RecG